MVGQVLLHFHHVPNILHNVQVLEEVDMSVGSVVDRIIRYSGKANADDPWPNRNEHEDRGADAAEIVGRKEGEETPRESPVELKGNHTQGKHPSVECLELSLPLDKEAFDRLGMVRARGESLRPEVGKGGVDQRDVSIEELAQHTTADSSWLAINGKVRLTGQSLLFDICYDMFSKERYYGLNLQCQTISLNL
jgi:hypothetical protein